MLLSIISPTYNEADNIIKFVHSIELTLRNYDYEIIFVDDNSSDKTHEIIKNLSSKKPNIRCLRRIGRRGLSSAVIEGCLSSSSDLLLIMDADLQHDEKIPLMLELMKEKQLDLVIASRFLSHKRVLGLSKNRNALSKLANFLANTISKAKLTDPMSGFFLNKKNCI